MSKIYIGIDPGVTGAVAITNVVLHSPYHILYGNETLVFDMPVISVANTQRKESRVWGKELFNLLNSLPKDRSIMTAVIERTHPMKDTAMTAFSMGMSRATILAALEIACIPYIEVSPLAWKKHFKLTKCDKDASRTLAIQRFPELTDQLKLKKHHNRAEALLLALYGKEAGL
jgi:crossover junction endodeoxyribonuclease RuvC